MFTGSHAINMDAKGRLAIPARLREALAAACEGRLVVTAHTEERCLLVYPEPQWREILPKLEALPSMNKMSRRIQRLMIGHATPLEMDSNGRVLLPPTLREYAQLEKKLMLVGLGKKLELWSEAHWESLMDEELDEEMPPELQTLSF